MKFYWLLLAILAVWRVTHLLQAEDGPWDLVVRLRRLAGSGFWGGLMDCFYCLSLWIAAPLAYFVGTGWKERLILWPALSAGAILLERLAPDKTGAAGHYPEYQEEAHVLRQESTAIADADDATAEQPSPAGR